MIDTKMLEKKVNSVHNTISFLEVKSPADNEAATRLDQIISQREKEVHAAFDPTIESARQAWKTALAQRDKFLEPLKACKKELRKKVSAFFIKQKRKAKEQEIALKRKAEQEKQREYEQQLQQAKAAAEKGDKEQAQQLKAQAQEIIKAPAFNPEVHAVPKAKGQVVTERWSAVVVDKSKVPQEYLIPDQKKLDKLARVHKSKSNIPGVEFKCKTSVHTRG